MYKRILVPIDGSSTAALGFKVAVKLAKFHDARLRLIYVLDEVPAVVPPAGAGAIDAAIAQLRTAGQSILADAEAEARAASVPAESKLLEEMRGHAGVHILWEAGAWQADLIVCGVHGRRGNRRLVMGSDAEYVLRRSAVPVLLVPNHLANVSEAA